MCVNYTTLQSCVFFPYISSDTCRCSKYPLKCSQLDVSSFVFIEGCSTCKRRKHTKSPSKHNLCVACDLACFLFFLHAGLLKIIVGVQSSSGNSAPNSGSNHHLTIPFEGGMHSFKRQYECV